MPAYENEKINHLNEVIKTKEYHNKLIEEELKRIKAGERRGMGENELLAIMEFERMIKSIPLEELKVINPDKYIQSQ